MPEYHLTAETPLNGAQATIGTVSLAEAPLEMVSLAVPQSGDAAFADKIHSAYGLDLPRPGTSALTADAALRLIWTAPDQYFLLSHDRNTQFEQDVETALGDSAYVTLQSDNWVGVTLSGQACQDVLERYSMLDTHPDALPIGGALRGMMKHLNVLLIRSGDTEYLLMTTSSAARSFWEGLEASAHAAAGLAAIKA